MEPVKPDVNIHKWLKDKDNRLSLYKAIRKRWRQEDTARLPANDPWWNRIFMETHTPNYEKIVNLVKIRRAIYDLKLLKAPIKNEDLIRVYDKYWERITEYVDKKPILPYLGATYTIRLLLERGFIHHHDLNNDAKKGYVVRSEVGGLVWPKVYSSKEDAINISKRVGIPGRVSIGNVKNQL